MQHGVVGPRGSLTLLGAASVFEGAATETETMSECQRRAHRSGRDASTRTYVRW